MCDMLFVLSSHPLSVSIYSLDNRCKQFSNIERAQIKERIDPKNSEGMNGYLSPCGGEPCPPVFRSPVVGMEDIMDNQVVCAIYGLPDMHKHITRPPPGVTFPKKTVTVGDIKPEPVLWHEDSGRRPMNNGRHNPPGTISGPHLGDAAHRLVANSLQVKANSNGYGNQMHIRPPPYARPQHHPPQSSYRNQGYYDQGHHYHLSNRNDRHDHGNHGYNERYGSSGSRHPRHGSHSQHYDRNNRTGSQHALDSRHVQYQSEVHQNVGPVYSQRPVALAPIPPTTPGYQAPPYQGGYDYYQNYPPSYGAPAPAPAPAPAAYQGGRGWGAPAPASQSVARGYSQPRQSSNPYSALDRGAHSRQPPPPGYGRR